MSRALTAKGAATRGRIVDGAVGLLRERGSEQVSLDDIRAATATSKSQLFHYFPEGRAQILLAVAEHEAEQVIEDQQPYLDELGPPASWVAWRDAVVEKYVAQGSNCPLTALTRQLVPAHATAVGPVVADMLEVWYRRIAAGVERSDSDEDPETRAAVILSAIQGGVALLQATGRSEFLRTALDTALEPVISAQRTPHAGAIEIASK